MFGKSTKATPERTTETLCWRLFVRASCSQVFYKLALVENTWERCRGGIPFSETGDILLLEFVKFFETGSLILNGFQKTVGKNSIKRLESERPRNQMKTLELFHVLYYKF